MAAPARAAPVDDLSAPAFADVSWLALLQRALPGATIEPTRRNAVTAARAIELRPLGDVFGDGGWGRTIRVSKVDAQRVEIDGKRRIIATLSLDDGDAAPVLLFEGEGEGRLLDAVNVRTDQLASFPEPAVQRLGPAGALLTARSTHSNSNQSYAITTLAMVGAERFTLIGTVLTYGERTCRTAMRQDLAIAVRPARPMARIDLAVTRREQGMTRDCRERPGGRRAVIRGAYVWDAARGAYVGRRAAIDRLEKANEGRF